MKRYSRIFGPGSWKMASGQYSGRQSCFICSLEHLNSFSTDTYCTNCSCVGSSENGNNSCGDFGGFLENLSGCLKNSSMTIECTTRLRQSSEKKRHPKTTANQKS